MNSQNTMKYTELEKGLPMGMPPGDRRWAIVQTAAQERWMAEHDRPFDADVHHNQLLAIMDKDPLALAPWPCATCRHQGGDPPERPRQWGEMARCSGCREMAAYQETEAEHESIRLNLVALAKSRDESERTAREVQRRTGPPVRDPGRPQGSIPWPLHCDGGCHEMVHHVGFVPGRLHRDDR
jgi:hypothetical protein